MDTGNNTINPKHHSKWKGLDSKECKLRLHLNLIPELEKLTPAIENRSAAVCLRSGEGAWGHKRVFGNNGHSICLDFGVCWSKLTSLYTS